MRAFRHRRRRGVRCVRVQVGRAEVDGLVAKGYLPPGDRENTEALEFAASSFISDALLGS